MEKGVVLVTGGARRIGRAISKTLAAAGWRVLVHARRADDPDALALAEELGGRAFFADLAEPLGPARLFNAVCAAEPHLSAIVNNAALFSPADALSPEDESRLMAVNAVAPEKLMTMLGLRLMTNDENGQGLPRMGAVVNLLDSRILSAPPSTPYARSKAALLDAQKRIAMQFATWMRVNGVAPGPVLAPVGVHEKGGETLLDARPAPEDVAEAVAYLLSAKAVTCCVLPIDSGQSLLTNGRAARPCAAAVTRDA